MSTVEREAIKKLLGDKPVAYHPVIAKLTGCVTSAIWFSQCMYWDSTLSDKRDGWFWKTYDEMKSETGLNRHEQDRARAKCKKLGIIQEQKKGLPLRLFYRIDWDKLIDLLSSLSYAGKQGGHMPANKGDIRRQPISENTSESTTEIAPTAQNSQAANPTPDKPKELKDPLEYAAQWQKDHTAHDSAVANPREARKQYTAAAANEFAAVLQHDRPTSTDTAAAKRAFDLHIPLADLTAYCAKARNGEGKKYRDKPDATAFWIVNELENHRARGAPFAATDNTIDFIREAMQR